MAVCLQGLRESLEMPGEGNDGGLWVQRGFPSPVKGACCRAGRPGLAGMGAYCRACLRALPTRAVFLPRGCPVAFHCYQGGCRDSGFIHSSQSVTVLRMACATADCMATASASVPRAGLETAVKSG